MVGCAYRGEKLPRGGGAEGWGADNRSKQGEGRGGGGVGATYLLGSAERGQAEAAVVGEGGGSQPFVKWQA